MRRFLPIVLGCLLLCACQGEGNRHAAPLPRAYPRIEMPDSEYVTLDSLTIPLRVNAGAEVRMERRGDAEWLDITYPGFRDGNVYLSINKTTAETRDAVIDNRIERMSLNTAGEPGERIEFVSEGGWRCMMLMTRGSLTTPIHILAEEPGTVLSGVMYLHVPDTTPADSVAPAVDAVGRDMLTMLKSL
ncbi:MAG: hypothetical protein NC039_06430 [Muribaculaceae bacterium]|nr:hypothetical protein [Muribaculaceae bacterium]